MKLSYVAILLLCAFSIYAQDSKTYKPIKDNLNIRADSTPMSSAIGVLNKDEEVEVVEERFEWYKIKLPERFICYLSSEYVEEIQGKKGRVTASSVNLRLEPTLQSPVIGKVKKGTVLSILENKNGWIKSHAYPHARGWVYKNFVKVVEQKLLSEEGTILTFKRYKCEANCLLNAKEKIPLKIKYRKTEKFLNKKAKIFGVKISNGCTYLLVRKLSLKK